MSAEFVLPAGRPWDNTIARAIRFVHQLDPGKAHVIKVERWKRERSDLQNRALWGLAYKVLSDETGNEPEDLHEFFCKRFFGVEEYEVLGDVKTRPRRTTTTNEDGKRDVLPTDRFAEFFSFIQAFAARELSIMIPDPDPEWFRKEKAA